MNEGSETRQMMGTEKGGGSPKWVEDFLQLEYGSEIGR